MFEGRSIKHATQDEVSRRVGELLRSYDYAASMDFGAFDGSCTSEIRNLVENDIIVSLFSKLLGTENDKGLLYQAVHDRIKQKANVSVKSVLKAVIEDMIRESGDRGTSILNFITNLVLFLANISMMLTKLGYKETEVKKMMWDVLTKGRHANIVAEGDDGLHAFVAKFVELFGGVHQFGKMWCACYTEYGFQIEPQGNEGEVKAEDCLTPTSERVEFCSKIQVAVGEYTYGFPSHPRSQIPSVRHLTRTFHAMTLVRPRLSPSCHPASGSRCCLNCVPICMKSTARKAEDEWQVQRQEWAQFLRQVAC